MKDWIEEMNEIAARHQQGDRDLLEDMITFLNTTKKGPGFLAWYRRQDEERHGDVQCATCDRRFYSGDSITEESPICPDHRPVRKAVRK